MNNSKDTHRHTGRCNKCGKKLDQIDTLNNFSFKKKLGYGTIYDGDILDISICCKCAEEFIKKCLINPIKEGAGAINTRRA